MQTNSLGLIAPIVEELTTLAEQLQHSTVQVRGRRGEAGSGVIWNQNGLIISNAHVVRGSSATVELSDGRTFAATVQRRDNARDLVALQVDEKDLPAVKVGDARSLRVGELVLAVGNPLGIVGALTTGIIHAVPDSESPLSYVQADVRLAPGNSGGLLANVHGEIIGINSMIVNGLAIAIPSNVVEQFLQSSTDRPRLGVTMQPVLVRWQGRRRIGLIILDVESGSPADSVLQVGDVILGVAGRYLRSHEDLSAIVSQLQPGNLLSVDFLRGGAFRSAQIQLHVSTEQRKAA